MMGVHLVSGCSLVVVVERENCFDVAGNGCLSVMECCSSG